MIRLTGITKTGRKFLLLGIDRENVNRLTRGQPILCKAETVGMDCDVIVHFGETLQDVADELARQGIIAKTTVTPPTAQGDAK